MLKNINGLKRRNSDAAERSAQPNMILYGKQ